MTDIDLTQEEADALIAMPKNRTNDEVVFYPGSGRPVAIPLVSDGKRENFLLDIRRGRMICSKPPTRTELVRRSYRLDLIWEEHHIATLTERKLPVLIFMSIKKVMELNGQSPFHRISSRMLRTYGKRCKILWATVIQNGPDQCQEPGADGSRCVPDGEVLGGEEGAGSDRRFCLIMPQADVTESTIATYGSTDYGLQIFPAAIPEHPHACWRASW
jgi:hypothetical protein